MMTSVRKTLKMLVWSAQNQSISSEICPESNHKVSRFLPTAFQRSLPWKFLWNSRKIGRFFCEFVPRNPAKFDFFSHDLSEALQVWASLKKLFSLIICNNVTIKISTLEAQRNIIHFINFMYCSIVFTNTQIVKLRTI